MGSDLTNDFNRFGHPGKYWTVTTHTGGQTFFTASHYGAGAIYISGSGFTTDDYVKFSGGGTIPLLSLAQSADDLFEFSLVEVSSSAASDTVYVLHTNKPRGVI